MASLLSFQNVSLFKNEEYGSLRLNFDIRQNKKYHFTVETEEKLNTILGLVEGRFQNDSGIINRKEKLFVQSDRLLLGDKVYSKQVDKWLALRSEFFVFNGRRKSKQAILESLKAKHIKSLPVYKLIGEDKIKFALLSLAFQGSGLLVISKLLNIELSDITRPFLARLIRETSCTPCLFSSLEKPALNIETADFGFEKIDLT